MAYNLRWPGLQDLDVYIIDNESKLIYDKQRRLPVRLNAMNTLENKYVRLIDIVSLFPNTMKVRVLNLVETLSSISSLKPLYKDRETELRFLHLSSLLAFILVYPFCKSFQKTRDAILRFLMGYSETVCMDCGFIQRECQCHIFDTGENADCDEVTEVVCKINEWTSIGTQTDPLDFPAQNIHINLPTSGGQLIGQSQVGPLTLGSISAVTPSTIMQGAPIFNIPSVVPFSTSFGTFQQAPSVSAGMFGAPAATAIGSIITSSQPSIISVTPSVPQVRIEKGNAPLQSMPPSNIKMGSNVVYLPPDVLAKSADASAQASVKPNVNSKSQNLFKLDPGTGMFMSEEFNLNPKTGKVTKRGNKESTDTGSELNVQKTFNPKRRKKNAQKRVIVKGGQVFMEEGEELDAEILPKRKRKKKNTGTVKELLLEKKNEDGRGPDKPENNNTGKSVETKEEATTEMAKNDELNESISVSEKEKGNSNEKEVNGDAEKDLSEATEGGPSTSETFKNNKNGQKEQDVVQESNQDKDNDGSGTDSASEGSDDDVGGSSSEEGEATDSGNEDKNSADSVDEIRTVDDIENGGNGDDSDVQVFDGVRYRVIAPKDDSKAQSKPNQLKVKMPFADKMKANIPLTIKPSPKLVIKPTGKPSTPGSILAKCNFSYTPSPTTGAPILQQVKKPALIKTMSVAGKDKPHFSVMTHNTDDTGKGYAKFEFAQTGEKMLRCIIYTCGQVFDTEKFAEIHQSLHQQGTPKELRCKLCNFKGHVLKWYDMLRHLKHTHGSVLKPKILPPKPKKKKDEDKETDKGKEKSDKSNEKENKDNKSDKTKEDDDKKINKTADVSSEKSEEGGKGCGEGAGTKTDEAVILKGSPDKRENNTNEGKESTKPGTDKQSSDDIQTASDDVVEKTDGLAALADVCDKLEPMDTSSSSIVEDSKEKPVQGHSTVKQDDEKKVETKSDKAESETKKADLDDDAKDTQKTEVNGVTKESDGKDMKSDPEKSKNKESGTNEKTNEEENMCDLCGIKFDEKKELNSHSFFHYYNKYKCIHCGGIMYTWEHLQRHLKECTDVEKGRVFFNCQYCHLSFRDRKSHFIHSISHGDPGLVCSYCDDDKSWDNWTALKKHYKVFHMAMRLLSAFKCDECNREFNTAKQYNNHMQDHKRRKERAAKMNKADQKDIDDMKDLEIQVTEDGQVKCPDCDQTFKNNHYMQMHHKFKHGEDITCPKCTYVAKSRLMLKIHMGKSHVEKSHKCGECGKTFAHYHQYKVHLSTHAQKTTFSCKFCQSGYPTHGELRQHMLKEHKLPAHKKLIHCEECDFKCFSRTTLKAHTRKNHPESSVVEDGEDHCYFNKKEPSPPPKASKKGKAKVRNQENVEKMLETKSKYFMMRHTTCCRTRNYEQNMEIKNRKMAAEKRSLEGPKKRGRKPKSSLEAAVEKEDPEVAEKKDPTWSPIKDSEPTIAPLQTPTEDFSQEDVHKIHENRAPNKRRSAPPKRYSPEREVVQVKKRGKSPPLRRPRSPKDKRKPSKSPVCKKKRSLSGHDSSDSYNYFQHQQPPLSSSTPYQSAQSIKERRRSSKQYEKRLKYEKPTLYAELMHVKKLKSVPMVVDQSQPIPIALLDHCYCRENRPTSPTEQQYEEVSYTSPDLSIVNTPDVADYEECLTDDVEIPSPLHSYHRSRPKSTFHTAQRGNTRGRQRGRPPGRSTVNPTDRKQPVVVRGVLTGGSVSTLQFSNSHAGQFTKLGNLLSADKRSGVNVRISGSSTSVTPPPSSTATQVRTVMASPTDDSMEFESDSLLPPGVEMQDDILKVAADMFINEREISDIADNQEHQLFQNQSPTNLHTAATHTVTRYPKPIVITRPSVEVSSASPSGSQSRVITITKPAQFDSSYAKVVTETVPQICTESPGVVTETITEYEADDGEIVTQTVYLEDGDIVTEDTSTVVTETLIQTQPDSGIESSVFTETESGANVPGTSAADLEYEDSESGMANEMAQELVQAILDHSRASETELDDIQLNEADYNMLLGSRNGSVSSTVVTSSGNTVQSAAVNPQQQQQRRSSDHQYF